MATKQAEKDDALSTLGVSPNDFASVLAEYNISETDVYIPKPPTTQKQNLDQLCEFDTEIRDEFGNVIEHKGHTGPLMFLEKTAEYDGEKFEGYDGFYVYTVLHPKRGKTVVTVGRPEGDHKPAIVSYLDTLTPGALFCVAAIPTSRGFRVFNPVPVPGTTLAAAAS